jgi:hypothetical protein
LCFPLFGREQENLGLFFLKKDPHELRLSM